MQQLAWFWEEDYMDFVCIFAQEIICHWALAAEGVSMFEEVEEKKKKKWNDLVTEESCHLHELHPWGYDLFNPL